jgi:uncharacterized protein
LTTKNRKKAAPARRRRNPRIAPVLSRRWFDFIGRPGSPHWLSAGVLLVSLALVVIFFGRPDAPPSEPVSPDTRLASPQATPGTTDSQRAAPPAPAIPDAAETTQEVADLAALASPHARLVLIIDDIGYNAEAGSRAIALPGAVTYAVLPHTPHGKMLAEKAHQASKEVMLHAPMSNLAGMALGEGGLTLEQDEEEFLQTLRLAIADIPHVSGVNNHTGSELTAAALPMQWVMAELKQQDLYFVDSMTTSASVAEAAAIAHQVPSLRRNVFLDNVATEEAIDFEFRRALEIARQHGYAVVIGHPYPETLAYLEGALPSLKEQGIELVSASAMIMLNNNGEM